LTRAVLKLKGSTSFFVHEMLVEYKEEDFMPEIFTTGEKNMIMFLSTFPTRRWLIIYHLAANLRWWNSFTVLSWLFLKCPTEVQMFLVRISEAY